jgi:hypothetical protein
MDLLLNKRVVPSDPPIRASVNEEQNAPMVATIMQGKTHEPCGA